MSLCNVCGLVKSPPTYQDKYNEKMRLYRSELTRQHVRNSDVLGVHERPAIYVGVIIGGTKSGKSTYANFAMAFLQHRPDTVSFYMGLDGRTETEAMSEFYGFASRISFDVGHGAMRQARTIVILLDGRCIQGTQQRLDICEFCNGHQMIYSQIHIQFNPRDLFVRCPSFKSATCTVEDFPDNLVDHFIVLMSPNMDVYIDNAKIQQKIIQNPNEIRELNIFFARVRDAQLGFD